MSTETSERMTAARRYAAARFKVSALKRAVNQANHRLAVAEKSGKAVKRAQNALHKVQKELKAAEETEDKLRQVARVVAAAARNADRLLDSAAAVQAKWSRDRDKGIRESGVQRKVVGALVDSPYGHLHAPDKVERVLHTIESMHRRRQLDARQKAAADRYRWAFEACPGSIRCALDQSGRGGGGGGAPHPSPSEGQLQAADWLRQTRDLLGLTDGNVVRLVCGEGMTLEQTASRMFEASLGRRPTQREIDVVGSRLRESLTVLADEWWPVVRKIRTSRGPDAKPTEVTSAAIDHASLQGQVAHATRTRVFGFEPQGGQPQDRKHQGKRRARR